DLGGSVRFWELASGKVRRILKVKAKCAALSPDGRTIALAGGAGTIGLRDLYTDEELGALEGHKGAVLALAFTPDGRKLISGGDDTAVLVWNMASVMAHGRQRSAALATEPLTNLWAALADADAGSAFQAMGFMLAAAPTQVVPFLEKRLQPVKA